MKNIALIVALALTTNLFAQKISLDKKPFHYRFRQLPAIKIDTSLRTINYVTSKPYAIEQYLQGKNYPLMVEGLTEVTENAMLTAHITLSDMIIEKTEIHERVAEVKDSEGKVTKRNYFYSGYVYYKFSSTLAVTDYKNNKLYNYSYTHPYSWTTQEKTNRNEIVTLLSSNILEIKSSIVNKEIKDAINSYNDQLKKISLTQQWRIAKYFLGLTPRSILNSPFSTKIATYLLLNWQELMKIKFRPI